MREDFSFLRVLGLIGTLGLSVALCVVGGVYGGMWLDGKLGTRGVMLLVGLFFGLGCGALVAYRMIVRSLSNEEKRDGEGD